MTGNEVNRNAMIPFYNLLFIGYIEIIMQLEKKISDSKGHIAIGL